MDYKITKLTDFSQIREGDLYLSTLQTTSKLPLVRVTNVEEDHFDYDGTKVSTGYSGWFSDKSYLKDALIVRQISKNKLEFLAGRNIEPSTIGEVKGYITRKQNPGRNTPHSTSEELQRTQDAIIEHSQKLEEVLAKTRAKQRSERP